MIGERATVKVEGAARASVRVESRGTAKLVRASIPQQAKIVRVSTPGVQGPLRLGRVRVDADAQGILFIGTAPLDTPENAADWKITRSIFSPAGIRIGRGTAIGVTWTGRANHSYS